MAKKLFLYNYKGQYHPTIRHRLKFDGKWFQHYHPNITYEGPISKSSATTIARSLRDRGYYVRLKRVDGGWAVYHRRK